MSTAILLIRCPDQRGLVARTAEFVASRNGNIVHADQHIDTSTGLFLMRLEWELDGFSLARDEINQAFAPLANEIRATWELHFSDTVQRISVWVSRQEHCLADLIMRQRSGELRAEIPLVISNLPSLQDEVAGDGIDFHCISTDDPDHEARQLDLLVKHDIKLVVLAKYMRILSAGFLEQFATVINIHHSFLPAFVGPDPYQQAFARGVKIIGATAHYVTPELDAGPIIEQDTVRISHRDSIDALKDKGRDLERVVLARAVKKHLDHRVIVHGNRTSIFD